MSVSTTGALSTLTFHAKKRLTQTQGNAIINRYISVFRRKNTRIKRQEPLFFRMFFPKNKKLIRGDTAVTERNDTTDAVDGFE